MTSEQKMATSPTAPSTVLRRGDWKSFAFAHGHFALHVASSHLLEVTTEIHEHLTGASVDPEIETYLSSLAATFPVPQRKEIKKDIGSVSLNMAQGCNLRCTYCFAGEGDYGNKTMMSFETARAAVSMFSAGRKWFHIIFFGGEPMLNFSVIKQVVEWCEDPSQTCKFSYSMTTNATLLNDERMQWLQNKNFAITISYDGKGLHARQRRNKDLISNSETLVEKRIGKFRDHLQALKDFRLRTTISRENLDVLEDAMVATLNSYNFKMYVSHHATPEKPNCFEKEDIDTLGGIYERVIDRFIESEQWEDIFRFENTVKFMRLIHTGKTGGYACGAGINYLTVSATGKYYLCHRLNEDEEESFGNVEDGVDEKRISEMIEFRQAKKDPCNSCWMREWCAGGCMHEHKAKHGNIYQIDPMYCRLQAIEINQAMRVYTTLKQKAPHLIEKLGGNR